MSVVREKRVQVQVPLVVEVKVRVGLEHEGEPQQKFQPLVDSILLGESNWRGVKGYWEPM